MKKILIALDYGPTAQQVVETGYSLAKAMNAEITLLHVVITPVYYAATQYSPIMGYTGAGMTDIISEDDLKQEAYKFLNVTKEHLGDDTIQTLVTDGDCADAILKVAKDRKMDIIIMGSHSRRWLEKILMGSITEKVLHYTTIPLFIIPTGENKKKEND